MKRLLGFLLLLVVVVVGLAFAVLNAQAVQLNYYFGSTEAPLSLVLVLVLAVGAILGVVASVGMVVGQRRELGRLQRKVKVTEQELKNLREIPIKD